MSFNFGDIVTFSDEWYEKSGYKRTDKRFVVTGKREGEIIYVFANGTRTCQGYHEKYLKLLKPFMEG